MSFTQQYNNLRIFKRDRRLKGRPAWQDSVPDTKQGRDTYAIADKNLKKFSQAFINAVNNILPDKMPKEFKDAYNQGTAVSVFNALPLFAEGTDSQNEVQQKFVKDIEQAYIDVLQESGEVETRNLNKQFDTKLQFSVVPLTKNNEFKKMANAGLREWFEMLPEDDWSEDFKKAVPITKAKVTPVEISEGRQAAREAARGFMLPVNPYSIEFMKERATELIEQGITKQQRKVVMDILADSFEKGLRAEETYKQIKANIGLTQREWIAIENRRTLLEDEGFPKPQIDFYTNKYRGELFKRRAERIGRTETIIAQARGRQDAWRVADESGNLPPAERQWVAAPPSPNPDRPCETCLDLDGVRTPITGTYESLDGVIDGPPAHPGCRCTEILVRAGAPETAKPPRRLPDAPPPSKKPIALPPELMPKKKET